MEYIATLHLDLQLGLQITYFFFFKLLIRFERTFRLLQYLFNQNLSIYFPRNFYYDSHFSPRIKFLNMKPLAHSISRLYRTLVILSSKMTYTYKELSYKYTYFSNIEKYHNFSRAFSKNKITRDSIYLRELNSQIDAIIACFILIIKTK